MAKERRKPARMKIEVIQDAAAQKKIEKAEVATQITEQDAYNAGDWLNQPVDLRGFKTMVNNSSILPQCIRAYKSNIAGFGIGVRYTADTEETPEMKAEFDRMTEIIELLNTDQDTKEVFEDVIEAREIYGISYIEVIRNTLYEVVGIEFVQDTPAVKKTRPLEPYIETEYYHHGRATTRRKKYCKYRQQIGGNTVYFKEFGDPRIMDNRSGEYLEKGETLEIEYQANELMEFAIGTMPYGEIRWMGQILGVDGSRRAEGLNNNYFINGRHTPLMIMIENGTLSDESFEKLQTYMNGIRGEAGQHAFIVLEAESTDSRTDFDSTEKPTVQIHDLAGILQQDELFQSYLENNRKRVQSAFQLPDLYVGYTTDFNRATAQTAQEVTEEQVFQPERKSLAWAINNRLLNEYRFQYVEAYFLEPNISNPDDTYKMLTALSGAGGLTMNKARELLYNLYGETAEPYEEDWGNLPYQMAQAQANSTGTDDMQAAGAELLDWGNLAELAMSVDGQITKAKVNRDDEIVPVLRETRDLLRAMSAKRAGGADDV